jgi:integrase
MSGQCRRTFGKSMIGRARLSYRRAAELLVAQTGWTLHQFRHSALTHLAENDVQLPLLMAKSRHRSLRTLQRYARPGPDAGAALTAAHARRAVANERRTVARTGGGRLRASVQRARFVRS